MNAPEDILGGKQFLFKQSNTTSGELWAEKIAAELGELLHLTMMHVQFAQHNGTFGVIMENFVSKDQELQDGGQLLSKAIPDFNVNSLDFYTIENIMSEIVNFEMETDFIRLCLFDALIASSDRHCENWGVIYDKGNYTFAPIYDNGNSLGFNVANEKLSLCEQAFQTFTNRSKTQIEVGGKRKPKTMLLLNYLLCNYHGIVQKEMDSYRSLDYHKVSAIINGIPPEIMSVQQQEWVYYLIKYRHKWLTEYRWKE